MESVFSSGISLNTHFASVGSLSQKETLSQVQSQVKSFGICSGKIDIEASFLRILRFPLPILIPPTAPYLLFILSLFMAVQPLGSWPLFQFLNPIRSR
jgi:hypothetical protein